MVHSSGKTALSFVECRSLARNVSAALAVIFVLLIPSPLTLPDGKMYLILQALEVAVQ